MKNIWFGLLLLVGSQSMANGHVENRSLSDSFLKTLPDAAADGLLIDGTLALTLVSLGLAGPMSIPISIGTALTGYSIRKTCNDHSNSEKDWVIAAGCGVLGGSIKYTQKALIDGRPMLLEAALGALDAGTYEATSGIRGNHVSLEIMAIETMVNAACYLRATTKPETFAKELAFGAAIGALVSGTIYTTHAWYEQSVKSWIQSWIHPQPEDKNINGDL